MGFAGTLVIGHIEVGSRINGETVVRRAQLPAHIEGLVLFHHQVVLPHIHGVPGFLREGEILHAKQFFFRVLDENIGRPGLAHTRGRPEADLLDLLAHVLFEVCHGDVHGALDAFVPAADPDSILVVRLLVIDIADADIVRILRALQKERQDGLPGVRGAFHAGGGISFGRCADAHLLPAAAGEDDLVVALFIGHAGHRALRGGKQRMDDDSGTGDGNAHRGGDGSHDALVYMDIGLPGGGTAVIGNPGKGDSRGTSLPVDGCIGRYGSGPREDHIGIPSLVRIVQIGLVIGRNHVAAGMETIRIEPVGAFPVVPQGIGRINAAQLTPLGFVHVINQQALGGIGIPALAAAVLIDKVFSLHVCVGTEGLVPVHGLQAHLTAGHGLCIFICHPAQQDFLLGAQVRGRFGVIVIATVVHQGEVVHSAGNAAAALAVRVIEIRHSQRVAEFVGRGAYAADVGSAAAPQFGGHKEPVHLHAIGLELHTRLIGRQAGVGPYGVFRAVFGLVVTGIKHQEHIHFAVSVGVVAGQAHLLCQMQEGFIQEIYGIHILPGAGKAVDEILPVIGHIVLEVIGP